MIRRISQQETFPLRSAELRNNKPFDQCVLPTDNTEGIYHLGYFLDDQLVCIGTFFPEDYPEQGTGGFRLRGMATLSAFAGKGYGAALINFAIDELTSVQASYIWCNARKAAVGFYSKLGFDIISGEFDVPGIGPHFDMRRQIVKNN
ncbi:GNAT family N-acetyltransferase [Pedobacter sp. L105]|uniref:GNAT family N-acetyltransferase n=1 Tax=Pedobacter sp. L105 TaxID=1641871 RepID=UPI00131DB4BA|nr:GNAT family N-acetyltransferase [Pedobacter sp. L105]